MKNKIKIISMVVAVIFAFTGTAMAASFAYGTVFDTTVSPAIPSGGATIKVYSDNLHTNLLGTGTSAGDGTYAVNLGDYSGINVYVSATLNTLSGDAVGSLRQYGNIIVGVLYLYPTNINISIPEFPTVALPIAAVIGLVFFFQQRKNKKE
jgi:hypothetical protein